MRFSFSIILFSIFSATFLSCTQQIDYNSSSNTSSSSSTSTSGGGTSNPYKPNYVPLSPTGDTSIWHPKADTASYKLVLTPTFVTPCATSNAVVSFTLTGTGIPANATYEWYFGDNNSQTTTTATVNNTYKYVNQSYTVLVKVDTGNKSSIAQITKTITVPSSTSTPVAVFTSQQQGVGAKGVTFGFNAGTSTVTKGTITNYHWTFGDGSSPIDTADFFITHTYSQINIVQKDTVRLTVKSDAGCLASVYNIVSIPN